MGLSIFLHSSEPRSLIYWRMPRVRPTPSAGVLFWMAKKLYLVILHLLEQYALIYWRMPGAH